MNIKSASGFPTPNTVCVREQARCAHFVQARTRSRIGSSKSALSDGGCSRRSVCGAVADRRRVGGVDVSNKETATESTGCNCASAAFDARGARSLFSRIVSNAAITRSRAGLVICGNHPKFVVRLQPIFNTDRSKLKFGGERQSLKYAAVLPAVRLIPANTPRNNARLFEASDVRTVSPPPRILLFGLTGEN